MGWIGKLLLALALVLLSAVATIWVGKDSELFRDLVAHEVGRVLQRTVTIGDLDIQLGSQLEVVINDLVVDQPEGISGPPFVRLASAQLHTTFQSLLADPPRIQSLSLRGTGLTLRHGGSGRSSWQFGAEEVTGDEPAPATGQSLPVLIERTTVTGLQIDSVDAGGRSRQLAADATLASDATGVKLTLDGMLNGSPIEARVSASPADAGRALKDVNIAAELSLDEVSLAGEAVIGDILAPERPSIDLTLRGPSVEYFTDRLNMAPISSGPLDVKISAFPVKGQMIVGVNGILGEFSVVLNGDVDNLRTLSRANLAIAVSGPNIGRISELAGIENVPQVPFSISGNVRRRGTHLEISDSRINIGRLQVIGSLDIPDLAQPARANLSAKASVPAIEVFSTIMGLPEGVRGAVATEVLLDASAAETTLAGSVTTDYGKLSVDGRLGGGRDLTGTSLRVSALGNEIGQLLEVAGLDPPTSGPWTLETDLSVRDDRLQLSSGKASLNDLTSEFSATIFRTEPLENLSGELAVFAANPRGSALPWLGEEHDLMPLIPDQAMDISVSATWSERELDLENLLVTLPDAQLRGGLTFKPDDPSLAGRIRLVGAELSGYLPPFGFLENLPEQQLDLPLTMEGEFHMRQRKLTIDSLNFQLGDLVAGGQMTLGDDLADVAVDLSVENAYDWFGADPKLTAGGALQATASAKLRVTDNTINIGKLNITTGQGGALEANGELHYGDSFAGTGLRLRVDLPDLNRLGLLAGIPLPHIPLQADVEFDGNQTRLTARQLRVVSLDSEFNGSLEVQNPSHPEISIALQADLLDVRPFFSQPTESDGGTLPAETPPPTAKAAKGARLIPKIALDLAPLAAFDADIAIDVERLVGHTRRLKDLKINAQVTRGSLLINEASGTDESQGKIAFSGFAVPGENGHRVGLDFDGYDINLGFPARSPDEVHLLPRFNMMGEMFSTGSDLRELAAGLNGAIQVTSGEGRVSSQTSGLLTNDFLDELFNLVNPLRQEEDYTQVRCMTILAEVRDGRLKGDPLATLVTNKLAIISKAQVNLADEKLFMTFNTIPQRGLGISASSAFNPFVGVAGTLAKPQLTLDAQGTVIQGSLAVATGGISLLGKSVLDRFTVTKKSCAKAETGFLDEHEAAELAYLKFRDATLSPVQQ